MDDMLSEDRQSQEEELLALESIMEESFSYNKPAAGRISCEVRVPVDCPEDGVEIEAWVPIEVPSEESAPTQEDASTPTSPQSALFQRSDSGHRNLACFPLKHLLPLRLQASFPDNYPSESAPEFNLHCLWLTKVQLGALSKQLRTLWEECVGLPILFSWSDWLQNNTLRFLGLDTRLVLAPPQLHTMPALGEEEETDGSDGGGGAAAAATPADAGAYSTMASIEETVDCLVMHNHARCAEEFAQGMQTCQICYDEQPGRDFARVPGCWHHFCRACANEYCRQHVREGTVQQLRCPETECDSCLPLELMRTVLNDEEFGRWERLTLQRTLDTMADVEYCPRCQAPVVCDGSGDHGQCAHCYYNFCRECGEAWHQGECFSDFHDSQDRKKKKKRKKNGPRDGKSDSSSEEEISGVSKDMRREMMRRKRAERESKQYMKTARRCPGCRVPVEKSEGCNKMTCCQCRATFCYICGARGDYSHFTSGKCQLFTINNAPQMMARPKQPVHEGLLQFQEDAQNDPNAKQNTIRCPRCRRDNLKRENNNHICCWACQQHFCYMCKKPIVGRIMAHFTTGACPQHSK
eukprot:scpid8300/ scgid0717/ E3 ubiquitin-protein ligase RNF14; Androgen receptor-associated protein 54; Protein Triad2; RING finger protein 14